MTELKVTAEPGVPQILTEREFDAPRDLLYRAFTEPDLLDPVAGAAPVHDEDRSVRPA